MMADIAPKLSDKQTAFVAAYLGDARRNATQAARDAGYRHPNKQGPALLVNLGIQAAIAAWREQAKQRAIADLSYRLERLDDLERRYWELIESRADEYANVPGGATGLLVRQVKAVISKDGVDFVTEYVADTAVTKEIRETHKQAAQELGQWNEHVNVSGSLTRRYIVVTGDNGRATDQ